MASQRWRDRLLAELHRQGLPSDYAARLVDELTDHAADLFTENPSMDAEQNADARLGTPEQVAAVARAEFRRRTFAGRHPVWAFLLGPIVAVIGITIGTFLTIAVASYGFAWWFDTPMPKGELVEAMNGPASVLGSWVFLCYSSVTRFVPFGLSTWIFVWLGRRSGRRRWSVLACGLIAFSAFFFSSKFTPEAFGFGFSSGQEVSFIQITQAAVPLGLGAWLLWRSSLSPPKTLAA